MRETQRPWPPACEQKHFPGEGRRSPQQNLEQLEHLRENTKPYFMKISVRLPNIFHIGSHRGKAQSILSTFWVGGGGGWILENELSWLGRLVEDLELFVAHKTTG